jgi:hypothetical protein
LVQCCGNALRRCGSADRAAPYPLVERYGALADKMRPSAFTVWQSLSNAGIAKVNSRMVI